MDATPLTSTPSSSGDRSMMYASFPRRRRALLTLAIGGTLLLTSAACDMRTESQQADRDVKAAIAKTVPNRRVPTTQNLNQAIGELNAAVNASKAGSPES